MKNIQKDVMVGDPYVFFDECSSYYYCYATSNDWKDKGKAFYIYKSKNLIDWEFVNYALDLRDKNISGQQLENALSEIGIVVNKNAIKDDPRPKSETSGIRIGVPAITTRGLTQQDVKTLTRYISNLINACKEDYESDFDLLDKFEKAHDNLKWHVFDLIMNYPLKDFYPKMYNELFEAKELSWV